MKSTDIIQNLIDQADEIEAEFLAAFADPIEDRVDVDSRLDWLLEKRGKQEAEIAKNNAIAERRLLQIEDWRQGENGKIERAMSWTDYQIRELLPDADEMQNQYGKRSRILPFGTVGYRKTPPKVEIFDEAKALEWARIHKVDIKVRESVSKTDLKKAIQNTQDPPDGFGLIPGSEEFFVRTDDTTKGA